MWIPDVGGDVFGAVGNLLERHDHGHHRHRHPQPVDAHRRGDRRAARRTDGATRPAVLVGIGVGHALFIDRVIEAGTYQRPLARTRAFLDALDAAEVPLAVEDRALAALGPKMLELAATRTAGAHPYLVTPEHTRIAREAVGPDALVATEQGVVLETDPERPARSPAPICAYLGLPNYTNNWKRLGSPTTTSPTAAAIG